MTLVLPKHLQHEIFMTVKRNFADFSLFDQLVEQNLKIAIEESNDIEINYLSTKRVIERYYDVQSFRSSEQKQLLRTINVIFKSCYVLILYYRKLEDEALFLSNVEDLVKLYPQFEGLENHELTLLLKFRNMLKIALMVIPAKKNKQILLKIVGRLEGEQKDYITGGGQTKAVNRRVDIYEQEGGVCAEKKVEHSLSLDCIAGIRFKQRTDSEDDDAATEVSVGSSSSSAVSDDSGSKRRRSPIIHDKRSKCPRNFGPVSTESTPLDSTESYMNPDTKTYYDENHTDNDVASVTSKYSAHDELDLSCALLSYEDPLILSSSSPNNSVDGQEPPHLQDASDNPVDLPNAEENSVCDRQKSSSSSLHSGIESSGEALEWVEFLNLPSFLRSKVWEVDPDPLLSDREVSTMVYCDYLSSNIAQPPPRVARTDSHDEEFKMECSNLHTHA